MERREITGFVLAGGQSRRMGTDKARIPWSSGTLLSHTVATLKEVVSNVFIVGGVEAEDFPAPVLRDKYPERGPLAGIHAALARTRTDWNLVLAVDLPLVSAEFLGFIAAEGRKQHAIAIVPKIDGRLQPLCGLYHRSLLAEIQRAIENGELSIHRLLEGPNTGIMSKNGRILIIEEERIVAQGFRREILMNVNTPEDLDKARGIVGKLHV